MNNVISSKDLKIDDLPSVDAEWQEISKFALTYDHAESGESFRVSIDSNQETNNLSISELREILYLQQRYWNYHSEEPDKESMKGIRNIILVLHEKIRNQ